MLDWHNKPWIKIISAVLIIAFLTYDIAWATDFTPIQNKQYAQRSLFKNKKINQDAISSQNEQSLKTIKDALSHKKNNVGNGLNGNYQAGRSGQACLSTTYIKDIANIYINDTLGKVIDSYTSPNPKGTVIHIQDLHTNPEASLNLANILEILIKDYDLGLVCSEGASGIVDTSSVSSFPDKETKEKVAKLFVNSGELTGEEYLSITKYPNLPIWGIEDKDIYFQHIIEFNKIIKFSQNSLTLINQIKVSLNNLKPKIYSKALLDIDAKEIEYQESKLDTAKYLEYLSSLDKEIASKVASISFPRNDNEGDAPINDNSNHVIASEAKQSLLISIPGLDISKYKNISIFKDTLSLEKTINQDKIIKQSQEILSSLQTILKDKDNKSELKALSVKASLFKDKKISPFSFYSYLKELALRHHVIEKLASSGGLGTSSDILSSVASDAPSINSPRNDNKGANAPNVYNDDSNRVIASPSHVIASPEGAKQSKYHNFIAFVDYLTKINSLDSNKLFSEIEDLSYEVKDLISDNNNQKLLTKALRNIRFLESFFNLKVSNEELEYYLKDKDSFKESWFKSILEVLDSASMTNSPDRSNNNSIGTQYSSSSYDSSIRNQTQYSSSGHESMLRKQSREESIIDKNLPDLENFYELAYKRDLALFNNATSEIETRKPKLIALIAGGFHTRGITKLLKDNNYSYVVISPYSKTHIDEENYRDLLAGKRKPLTELIKGFNGSLRLMLMWVNDEFREDFQKYLQRAIDAGIITKDEINVSDPKPRFICVMAAVMVQIFLAKNKPIEELASAFKPAFTNILKGNIAVKQAKDESYHINYEDQYLAVSKDNGQPIREATKGEFEIENPIVTISPTSAIEYTEEVTEPIAHFSLLSSNNSLSKEGEVTTDKFQIGEIIYTIGEPNIGSISQLGELINVPGEQNGQNITFTIRGPTISEKLQEYLTKTLPEALIRSASLYQGNLSNNITIILADKYDYIAGDHKDNNIIILNASDLEKMIQDGVDPVFISELITSILSEELAHERGAGNAIAIEEALARACADNSKVKLNAALSEYIAFLGKYTKDLESQNGYIAYLKHIEAQEIKAAVIADIQKQRGLDEGQVNVLTEFLNGSMGIDEASGRLVGTVVRMAQGGTVTLDMGGARVLLTVALVSVIYNLSRIERVAVGTYLSMINVVGGSVWTFAKTIMTNGDHSRSGADSVRILQEAACFLKAGLLPDGLIKPSRSAEEALKHLQLQSGDTLLSLGSGASVDEVEFALKVSGLRIIALDRNADLMAQAKTNAQKAGVTAQFDFKEKDFMQEFDLADNSVKAIYARLSLHGLSRQELKQVFTEMYRVLAPGGKIFVVVKSDKGFSSRYRGASYDKATGLWTYVNELGEKLSRQSFENYENLKSYAQDVGLGQINVTAHEEIVHLDSARTALDDQPTELLTLVASKPVVPIVEATQASAAADAPRQLSPHTGLCVTGDTLLPVIHSSLSLRAQTKSGRSNLNFIDEIASNATFKSPTRNDKIEYIPIIDVKLGDYVLSLNEQTQKIEPHRINALLDMGVKPVYRLTTASGRSIKTTANHPYLVKVGGSRNLSSFAEASEDRQVAKSSISSAQAKACGYQTGWFKVKDLNVGQRIAVPRSNNLCAVNFFTMAGFGNKNTFAFPIKSNSTVSDLKTIRSCWASNYAFCKNEWIRLVKIMFEFYKYSMLDIFRQLQKHAFCPVSKIINNHLSPAFFLTSWPETRPDLRDSSRDARNSGLEDSISSSISSIVFLSKTSPSVTPFLSTRRTMPFNENGNFAAWEGSKRTTFSSDNPFNSGTTIFSPPLHVLKEAYHILENLSSKAYAEIAETPSRIEELRLGQEIAVPVLESVNSISAFLNNNQTAKEFFFTNAANEVNYNCTNFFYRKKMDSQKDNSTDRSGGIAQDISEISITGDKDERFFLYQFIYLFICGRWFDISNIFNFMASCYKKAPNTSRTICINEEFHRLYGRLADQFLFVSQKCGIKYTRPDIFTRNRAKFLFDLFKIHSSSQCFKDYMNRCASSFNAWFTMLDVRINNNMFFNKFLMDHFIYLLHKVYHAYKSKSSIAADTDILWDKIASIEFVGYEHVYDIEVDGTHNFIGNGIFAHNTYTAEPAAQASTADAMLTATLADGGTIFVRLSGLLKTKAGQKGDVRLERINVVSDLVDALVEQLGLSEEMKGLLVIAVNSDIIYLANRSTTVLKNNDRVSIISSIAGGMGDVRLPGPMPQVKPGAIAIKNWVVGGEEAFPIKPQQLRKENLKAYAVDFNMLPVGTLILAEDSTAGVSYIIRVEQNGMVSIWGKGTMGEGNGCYYGSQKLFNGKRVISRNKLIALPYFLRRNGRLRPFDNRKLGEINIGAIFSYFYILKPQTSVASPGGSMGQRGITQKPLGSDGLIEEVIKAQVAKQEVSELKGDVLRDLATQLAALPRPQSQTQKFKNAFPTFEQDLAAIINILNGNITESRAPPRVYQLTKPLLDKDGLPIPAIAYRDENGVLQIYITQGNLIGLFHELYEHELQKGHTLAAVVESAFSDNIISKRAKEQLTSMDETQLKTFQEKYGEVQAEIKERFQEKPIQKYVLSFAQALNEYANTRLEAPQASAAKPATKVDKIPNSKAASHKVDYEAVPESTWEIESIAEIPEGSEVVEVNGVRLCLSPLALEKRKQLDKFMQGRDAIEIGATGLTKLVNPNTIVVVDLILPQEDRVLILDDPTYSIDTKKKKLIDDLMVTIANSRELVLRLEGGNIVLQSDVEDFTMLIENSKWERICHYISKLSRISFSAEPEDIKNLLKEKGPILLSTDYDLIVFSGRAIETCRYADRIFEEARLQKASADYSIHFHPHLFLVTEYVNRTIKEQLFYYDTLLTPSTLDLEKMKGAGARVFEIRALGRPGDLLSQTSATSRFYVTESAALKEQPEKSNITVNEKFSGEYYVRILGVPGYDLIQIGGGMESIFRMDMVNTKLEVATIHAYEKGSPIVEQYRDLILLLDRHSAVQAELQKRNWPSLAETFLEPKGDASKRDASSAILDTAAQAPAVELLKALSSQDRALRLMFTEHFVRFHRSRYRSDHRFFVRPLDKGVTYFQVELTRLEPAQGDSGSIPRDISDHLDVDQSPIVYVEQTYAVRYPLDDHGAFLASENFFNCNVFAAKGWDAEGKPWLILWHFRSGPSLAVESGEFVRRVAPMLLSGLRDVQVVISPEEGSTVYPSPDVLQQAWGVRSVTTLWRKPEQGASVIVHDEGVGLLLQRDDFRSVVPDGLAQDQNLHIFPWGTLTTQELPVPDTAESPIPNAPPQLSAAAPALAEVAQVSAVAEAVVQKQQVSLFSTKKTEPFPTSTFAAALETTVAQNAMNVRRGIITMKLDGFWSFLPHAKSYASNHYFPFEMELKSKLSTFVSLDFAKLQGILIACDEVALNIMLHGGGGTIQVFLIIADDGTEWIEIVGENNNKKGIEDPRIELEKSKIAHSSENTYSGGGFLNIVSYPDKVTIETKRKRWEKLGTDKSSVSLTNTGTSDVQGTKITLAWQLVSHSGQTSAAPQIASAPAVAQAPATEPAEAVTQATVAEPPAATPAQVIGLIKAETIFETAELIYAQGVERGDRALDRIEAKALNIDIDVTKERRIDAVAILVNEEQFEQIRRTAHKANLRIESKVVPLDRYVFEYTIHLDDERRIDIIRIAPNAPDDNDTVESLRRLLAKNPEGTIHHIEYFTDNVVTAGDLLKTAGFDMAYEKPIVGAGGITINFLPPIEIGTDDEVLIELAQEVHIGVVDLDNLKVQQRMDLLKEIGEKLGLTDMWIKNLIKSSMAETGKAGAGIITARNRNNELLGIVVFSIIKGAFNPYVYVRDGYSGQGIGTAILTARLTYLVEKLHTWQTEFNIIERNKEAGHLWLKLQRLYGFNMNQSFTEDPSQDLLITCDLSQSAFSVQLPKDVPVAESEASVSEPTGADILRQAGSSL